MKHLFYSLVVYWLAAPVIVLGRGHPAEEEKGVLLNPLRPEIGSLENLFVALLNVFIIIATPIIVFFIILAGFKYVTAQGNATKVEEANRSITYAVIGGVLILGSVVLIEIISNLVGAFAADTP